MLQVVLAIEEQWFAPFTDNSPIRTSRTYRLEELLYAAQDEEAAYQCASQWIANHAFSDSNHDGEGDLTKYFALGIHQLEEVTPLNEIPEKAHNLYGIPLTGFSLSDIDQHGVPLVRPKEELEIFRLLRIRKQR